MGKNLSLEEMRQLFIDLIYESDDERTCDGDCDCDINERPETKCRTCAAGLVAEYEKKVKAKALEDFERCLTQQSSYIETEEGWSGMVVDTKTIKDIKEHLKK